jgi:hypothetical protein
MELLDQQDAAKSLARIHKDVMDRFGIANTSVIQVKGKRTTYAKCVPLMLEGFPKDQAEGIVRIDGLTRANLGVAVGDTVVVSKARTKLADKIVVRAFESIPPLDERYMADALEGFPLTTGDDFLIPYFGGQLAFKVLRIVKLQTKDDEILDLEAAALVTRQTTFTIKKKEELQIRLDIGDILKKEDSTGNVTIGFTILISCDDVTEVGEFQRLIEIKDNEIDASKQRKKLVENYQRYNEIVQEVKQKAHNKIIDLINKENDKTPDDIRKLLREAKIEILTKCAEVE